MVEQPGIYLQVQVQWSVVALTFLFSFILVIWYLWVMLTFTGNEQEHIFIKLCRVGFSIAMRPDNEELSPLQLLLLIHQFFWFHGLPTLWLI
jgi:hypothetical protein